MVGFIVVLWVFVAFRFLFGFLDGFHSGFVGFGGFFGSF